MKQKITRWDKKGEGGENVHEAVKVKPWLWWERLIKRLMF